MQKKWIIQHDIDKGNDEGKFVKLFVHFKVVWDTMQCLLGWKGSKKWLQLGFEEFQNLSLLWASPQKAFLKFNKRYKKINRPGSRYEAATHRLLGITDWATAEVIKLCTNKTINEKSFQKEAHHMRGVSHSPLKCSPSVAVTQWKCP